MKITGAIFDMDGTILDSMFIWGEGSVRKYVISRGVTPKDDFETQIKGKFLAGAVEYLEEEYGFSSTRDELIDGLYKIAEEAYRTEVRPKPGIIGVLEDFRKRGVKMCVATATEFYVAEMVLKKLDMLKYFSGVLTCSMVGAGKDKPAVYEAALELLGTPKSETPVFEDALYAIKTAKSAGFVVAGVYDEFFKSDQKEIKSLSDFYIESYGVGIAF